MEILRKMFKFNWWLNFNASIVQTHFTEHIICTRLDKIILELWWYLKSAVESPTVQPETVSVILFTGS